MVRSFERMSGKLWRAAAIRAVENFKRSRRNWTNLQNQKNKILEDLSLVRGKMQSQKTAVGRRRPKPPGGGSR